MYNNIDDHTISLNKYPRLIIQLESLNRVAICEKSDIVILDEVESIWSQFDSGNFADLSSTIQIFQYLIKHAKDIIVMDANLSHRTLNLFESLIPGHASESSMYINTFNPSQDIRNCIVPDRNTWIQKLGEYVKAGKNVMIMINSLKTGKKIYKFIRGLLGKEDVMFYSSETLESTKSKHFKEVNKYWSAYRVVICTPTISAGVSFEKEHFHAVMGYFCDLSCNVQTCQQMIGRVRNVINNEVILFFPKLNYKTFSTDADSIEEILRSRRAELVRDIGNKGIGYLQFDIDESGITYNKNFSYWLVIYNIAYDNESRNNFEALYVNILKSKNSIIRRLKSGKEMEYVLKFNASNNEYDTEFTAEVNAAELLSADEYKEIKDKRQMMLDIPEDEVVKYNKFRMIKSLQNDPTALTLKQVDTFYKNHRNLARIDRTREICELLGEHTWDESIAILEERDYRFLEKRRGTVDINRVTLNSKTHKYIKELIQAYPGFGTVFPASSDLRKLFTTELSTQTLEPGEKIEFQRLLNRMHQTIDYTEKMSGCCFEQLCSIIQEFYMLDLKKVKESVKLVASPHISFKYSGEYYIASKHVTPKKGVAGNIPVIDC
jgi:hypothetical protein